VVEGESNLAIEVGKPFNAWAFDWVESDDNHSFSFTAIFELSQTLLPRNPFDVSEEILDFSLEWDYFSKVCFSTTIVDGS
jgi:hypothetical protein